MQDWTLTVAWGTKVSHAEGQGADRRAQRHPGALVSPLPPTSTLFASTLTCRRAQRCMLHFRTLGTSVLPQESADSLHVVRGLQEDLGSVRVQSVPFQDDLRLI